MIDAGDILNVVRQRFAANAAAVAGITGGLHEGRAVGDTAMPYGVVDVRPETPDYNAQGYLQRFNVSIRLYMGTDAESAQAKVGLLDTAIVTNTRAEYTTTTGTTKLLHARKIPGEWRKEEDRNEGSDVHVVTCVYEFLVQG